MKNLKQLINSLTKSEKRYFKVNSSTSKTNKTLIKMFDLLDKNDSIEDKLILKTLNLKSKNNLAVIETRLQTLILKHLRGFHANSTQSIELNNLIIEIEILYHKRLFISCKKLINKAKKIAVEQQNHIAHLSILKWQSFIEKEEGKYLHQSQEQLKMILSEEKEIINNYKSLIEYKYHTFNLLLLSKNKALASLNQELEAYDVLIKDGYFNEKKIESFDKKLFILNFKGMYYMSKGNYSLCLDQYEKLIKLIECSTRKNILKSSEYFLALNNLLLIQVMNKRFSNSNATLSKIYRQFESLTTYEPLLFNITQNYELGIYCELGDTEKGIAIIPEIEAKLKKYGSETNEINKLLFYLNIAIMYLFNKNYKKSIYWFNEYLNDYSIKKNDVASNIFYYSHIINMITHFEAKNYDAIGYLYNESINNLKKIRPLNRFDSTLLNFINQFSNEVPRSEKEIITSFNHLKKELLEISKDQKETIALQFFDFFAWIESHLTNKSIAEIIRKKQLG